MKTFDLSTYYLLFQVFEATGEAMFGGDWSGHEIRTKPPAQKLRKLQAERDSIESRLLELENERQDMRSSDSANLSPAERERWAVRFDAVYKEQNQLRKTLASLPDLRYMSFEDEERYERRVLVERELNSAFETGALSMISGHGFTVDWRTWPQAEGFAYDFYLSTIDIPAAITNPYTAPALVIREQFDLWVKRFTGNVDAPIELTPEAQLEAFLHEAFKSDPHANLSRSDLEIMALKEITGISKRGFATIWRNIAPESRKKAGRKRKTDA